MFKDGQFQTKSHLDLQQSTTLYYKSAKLYTVRPKRYMKTISSCLSDTIIEAVRKNLVLITYSKVRKGQRSGIDTIKHHT